MKYQLRKGDTAFAIGQTNFSESKGSLIDTNGCIALSVISGYAIATINFKKISFAREILFCYFTTVVFSR